MPEQISDRFVWNTGDIDVTIPQCSNCKHNVGSIECDFYGVKPDKYITNTETCPHHEKE